MPVTSKIDRPRTERINVLDALRGFAVFGMLMINVRVFSAYTYLSGETDSNFLLAGWNAFFDQIHIVLFNGKFYTLFALLFGIGFAMQMNSSTAANRDFIPHFTRRLFFLLLIGLIHLWAIWFSDILVFYAICGYILIFFRALPDRWLIWMAALLLFLPGIYSFYLYMTDGGYTNHLYHWLSEKWAQKGLPRAYGTNDSFHLMDVAMVIREGSFSTVLKFNSIGPVLRMYIISLDARIFKILAIFILGFWAGRHILHRDLLQNRSFLIKTIITGSLIGLPLNVIFAMDNFTGINDSSFIFIKDTLVQFGYISLTSAYAASFILLYRSSWQKFLNWSFNSVGKTALTNYILQSVLGIVLFYSAGLGLGEYFGSAMLTFAVLVIFGFQIFISNIWLKYYIYGPVEWIWRVLTYGQPIKNRLN
jgi:uncharacterized protein